MEHEKVKDAQSRDWMFTLKIENDSTLTTLLGMLGSWTALEYVFQHERGSKSTDDNPDGYDHFQGFLRCKSSNRFSTVKNHFIKAGLPTVHIEARKGSPRQAYDYCTKEDTRIEGPWQSAHIMDNLDLATGKRNDIEDARELIESGLTPRKIMLADSEGRFAHLTTYIETYYQARLSNEYATKERDVLPIYLYGETGSGKSRWVADNLGYPDVYTVSDYTHPYDGYTDQKILVFDEFHSQRPIEEMLRLLDPYPVELPARYHNKQACYRLVIVISNFPLATQYETAEYPQRAAFQRRFFLEANRSNSIDMAKMEYLVRSHLHLESTQIPEQSEDEPVVLSPEMQEIFGLPAQE
ncbi:replication-associated family protein [Alloscardovia omnicolens]|uniref:replication-associated family protein n=1 Tax=Alloscardovia omnicolens TaxID=419015 RepID=UPI0003B5A8C1|nr:replication-associated family protein [Alloscardovia omnicolens]